ncbi:hypothetical protein [Streptomyces sp. NPDC087294]|uniref:hypothetical protein n=1 Tax=Streptomyces sp. NPDC087294 TaxID=3365777 RepID=UPI0038198094
MDAGHLPWWQWPLQNSRRLLGTLAAAAMVFVALALLLNSPEQRWRSADSAPAGPSSPSATGAPARSPSPTPTSSETTDYGAAIDTARAFVLAWSNHKPASSQAWYAGAARYATDDLALQLTTVDYRNVPVTLITGKLKLTDTGGVGRTEVAVPTDTGMMSVQLVEDGTDGWLVGDIQPGAQAEQ